MSRTDIRPLDARWVLRPQDAAFETHPEGDIGGDAQRGDAWGRRFVRDNANGTWDIVTIAFYTAASLDPQAGDYVGQATHITRQSEWTRCTDLADPGGSEVASVTSYQAVSGSRNNEARLTDAMCQTLRDDLTIDAAELAFAALAPHLLH